jgi:hypothetical protein
LLLAPPEEQAQMPVPEFSIIPHVLLSFANFNLHPFSIKSLNHDYNSFPESHESSNNWLIMSVVLGTPNTNSNEQLEYEI